MNHVYGNGEGPEKQPSKYDALYKDEQNEEHEHDMSTPRNERKPPLFIFMKHMIQDANQENIGRIERYVNNYCGITNANDKMAIREMFNNRVKELMK